MNARSWLAAVALVAGCDEVEPPPRPEAWATGPQMPARRLEPGVAALGSRLAVIGGFATGASEGVTLTDEVLVLDTFTGTWSSLPPAPLAVSHAAAGAAGGQLFLFGGLEGTQFIARGESWRLALDGEAWVPIAAMPAGDERGAAAVVSAPGHFFLLGGSSTTGALASCLDYDLIADRWTRLPDLPSPRSHAAAMRRDDGTLIVAGGLAGLDASRPLDEVWALPPGATAWQPRAAMPTARGGCAHGEALGQLICAGGEAGSFALRTVEGYDPYLDVWTELPSLPVARAGTQAAAIGQQLYVPGGAGLLAFEPTDTLLVFSPIHTVVTSVRIAR